MEFIKQLVEHLYTPAQIWTTEGQVEFANQPFNTLFDLPQDFNWKSNAARVRVKSGRDTFALWEDFSNRNKGGLTVLGPHKVPLGAIKTQGQGSVGFSSEQLELLFRVIPLMGADGEALCFVCLAERHDFPRDQYETELLRIQSGENLRILASGVAHEFNNIFTGIKGLSDLIKDEVDQKSEIFEFAQSIQNNIARGVHLIQQLSGFAKHLPHSLKRVRLSAYIEHMVPLVQIQLRRRINVEIDNHFDGYVMIDQGRMDQALSNIMHNAQEAMGGEGRIRITVDRCDPDLRDGIEDTSGEQWALIEVADSGPGIPPELEVRVLEPFFTTKERGKSTGLGLPVTNRIVMSHKGLLQIRRSAELGGAAVRIYLPLEQDGEVVPEEAGAE